MSYKFDGKYKITSPIYLLRSTEVCWKCDTRQDVIALAAVNLSSGEPEQDPYLIGKSEPFILDVIEDMPKDIYDYIRCMHPRYEKRMSRTAGFAYFMNTCSCGASFGDFYLHYEPDHAFFPTTKEAAANISAIELPITGTFDFKCSYGIGPGAFILEHAKRK